MGRKSVENVWGVWHGGGSEVGLRRLPTLHYESTHCKDDGTQQVC